MLDFSVLNGDQPTEDVVGLDREKAVQRFGKYLDHIQILSNDAKAMIVDDQESAARATDLIADVGRLLKIVDKERLRIIEKPDVFVRAVNAFVRPFKNTLEAVKKGLREKVSDFSYQVELARRQEQKRLEDEQKKKQAELDRAAEKSGVEKVTLPTPVLPKKQQSVRGRSGSASIRMVPDYRVVDADKIPRQYLMPDDKAIKAAMGAGIKDIPGIEFFEKPITTVRQN